MENGTIREDNGRLSLLIKAEDISSLAILIMSGKVDMSEVVWKLSHFKTLELLYIIREKILDHGIERDDKPTSGV